MLNRKITWSQETENDGSIYAVLYSVDREGFTYKVILEQKPEGSEGASYVHIWEKRLPSRETSKYKNLKVRV